MMPTTRMCWSRRCWGWRKCRQGPLWYSLDRWITQFRIFFCLYFATKRGLHSDLVQEIVFFVFYGKSKVLTMPTTRMCWSRRCWGWRKGRRGPLCYSATGVLPCSAAWTVVQAWSLCKVSSVCLRGRCGGHCGGHQCLVVVMVIEESKSTVIGCHRTFMCNFNIV